MDAAPGCHDLSVHEPLYLNRTRIVDDAELNFGGSNGSTSEQRIQDPTADGRLA
jgi:hypothetical protein